MALGHYSQITYADLKLLQDAANAAVDLNGSPLQGSPFYFIGPIWKVAKFSDLLSLYELDTGEYPGAIAVVDADNLAYQITGPYRLEGSWTPYPKLTVGATLPPGNPAGYLLYYEKSTSTVSKWANGAWQVLRGGANSPNTFGVMGFRLEFYRLWRGMMTNTKITRGLYTPTPPDNKERLPYYSNVPPNSARDGGVIDRTLGTLLVRTHFSPGANNPIPVQPWHDALKNIDYVFDPVVTPAPVLKTVLEVIAFNITISEALHSANLFEPIDIDAPIAGSTRVLDTWRMRFQVEQVTNPAILTGQIRASMPFDPNNQADSQAATVVIDSPSGHVIASTSTLANATATLGGTISEGDIVEIRFTVTFFKGFFNNRNQFSVAHSILVTTENRSATDAVGLTAGLKKIAALNATSDQNGTTVKSIRAKTFLSWAGEAFDWSDVSDLRIDFSIGQAVVLAIPAPVAFINTGLGDTFTYDPTAANPEQLWGPARAKGNIPNTDTRVYYPPFVQGRSHYTSPNWIRNLQWPFQGNLDSPRPAFTNTNRGYSTYYQGMVRETVTKTLTSFVEPSTGKTVVVGGPATYTFVEWPVFYNVPIKVAGRAAGQSLTAGVMNVGPFLSNLIQGFASVNTIQQNMPLCAFHYNDVMWLLSQCV